MKEIKLNLTPEQEETLQDIGILTVDIKNYLQEQTDKLISMHANNLKTVRREKIIKKIDQLPAVDAKIKAAMTTLGVVE